MTARDDLKDAWVGHDADEIDHLIDAYAHELAEKIRARAAVTAGYDDGMRYAAALIDPEVTE